MIYGPRKIAKQLRANGIDFKANDNISKYLSDAEKEAMLGQVEKAMEKVLEALIIDTENDHNTRETAKRVSKMWVEEVFAGRYDPVPKITSFPNVGYDGLYISGPITIKSTCAQHFQNIVGKAWVGVVRQDEVIGLSKFNRLIDHIARRPQIQEEMTTQIAHALKEYAKTPNIGVIVKAEHHCMTHRGMREHESDMTTSVMLGDFKENRGLQNEFLQLVTNGKSYSE